MNFKRLLAFVVSASMIVGMFPAFVLADENDPEPSETTVVETTAPKATEPSETKAKKPEEKKEEPEQTKEEGTEPTEETKPSESEEKQPDETKPAETTTGETKPEETKPEETKPEETEPSETKPQESSEPENTQPSETEPTESSVTEPSVPESSVPESDEDKPTGLTAIPANGEPISTQKDGEPDNDELFKRFAESKLYTTASPKGFRFDSVVKLKRELRLILVYPLENNLSKVAHAQHDPGNLVAGQVLEQIPKKRFPSHGSHTLGHLAYNATEPSTKPTRQNNNIHRNLTRKRPLRALGKGSDRQEGAIPESCKSLFGERGYRHPPWPTVHFHVHP